MISGDEITTLRRKRGYWSDRLTSTQNQLDDYEQAGSQHLNRLADIEKYLDEVKHQVEAAQLEIELSNPEEQTRGLEIKEQYYDVRDRLRSNQGIVRQAPSPRLTHNEQVTKRRIILRWESESYRRCRTSGHCESHRKTLRHVGIVRAEETLGLVGTLRAEVKL